MLRTTSLCLALSLPGLAQTVTVTTTEDVVDFGGPQQVADLPGPDGVVSFREACTAVNNTTGPQTIAFAIPNVPGMQWVGGVATLEMAPNATFFLTDDETTIDFSTQTAFTGDTNPLGNEVGIWTGLLSSVAGIYVAADRCTVRGLDSVAQCGYGIDLAGNDNTVVGCTISGPIHAAVRIRGSFFGPAVTGNVVGGTLPGEANTLTSGGSAVRIDAPADDNRVIGNVLIGDDNGVRIVGSEFTARAKRNLIGGPTPEERNLIAGAGSYSSEGAPTGSLVHLGYTEGTVVEGNYIGTTADGSAPAPGQRAPVGVEIVDSHDTVVRGNVIGGVRVTGINHYAGDPFGDAIFVVAINDPTSGTTIENNLIGVDPTGTLPVPSLNGVRIDSFTGTQPLTGTVVTSNVIAHSEQAGVVVGKSIGDARLTGNSIHSNGALGIDLHEASGLPGGVTLNDPLDADSGANGLQNYPVLASASLQGTGVHVLGSLNSTPLADFTVEVFASPTCDPSGFGEGQLFLGSVAVATDAAGNASIDAQLATPAQPGWFVAATATAEPTGATSEFGACVALTGQGAVTYCTPGTSASGCQATLSASGVASATAPSGFDLLAGAVEGAKDGLFFYGTSGRQANPWGSGTSFQCVAPPVTRGGLLAGSGTTGACDGAFAQDLNALWTAKPAKNPGAGALVQAQLWYRDPQNTSNQTTSLSDALEFPVAP